MDLTARIPDDLAGRMGGALADLSRRALEALAAEEYKLGRLTKPDLRRLFGFETGRQIDEFLKSHDVFEDHALADLPSRLQQLAGQWRRDIRYVSSTTAIAMNPTYQRIIGLGPAAVPLILRELAHDCEPWFWALKAITGEDPVPEEHRGRMRAMRADWLNWGRARGYDVNVPADE